MRYATGCAVLVVLASAAQAVAEGRAPSKVRPAVTGVELPVLRPGRARARVTRDTVELGNDTISMRWDVRHEQDDRLVPRTITDRAHGRSWSQEGSALFRIATGTAPHPGPRKDLYIGMRIRPDAVEAVASIDGRSWVCVHRHALPAGSGRPAIVRVGKTDMKGGTRDYGSRGDIGTCRIDDVEARDAGGAILFEDRFALDGPAADWRQHLSTTPGTVMRARDGLLDITTGANCATFVERALPANTRFVSCRVTKGTDRGLSWGPGLTVVFENGEFVVCGVRSLRQLNVHTKNGERILASDRGYPPSYDLDSSRFVLAGRPEAGDLAPPQEGKEVRATLACRERGIEVAWRAILRDGSHYVRQEFEFASAAGDVPVRGLELLDLRVEDLRQVGSVAGSPVAGSNVFAGIELPVTSNVATTGGVRAGFPCRLTLGPQRSYTFSTVVGAYAAGQLRRTFLCYVERERARPSKPFLHYNCWYDLGYNINAAGIVDAATQFQRHLAEPFGLKVDAYVLDDGWDDFHRGLWVTNLKRFPGGFEALSKELAKRDSNIGIWISPMGGYGGDKQRTALAKKMGLISGEKLDLAEDAYYRWYRDKCRSLMEDHGVNYFKWDRAGSGASPHFMALLNIARELRQVDPNVFINVTVGTWPSPFWLNHIDCTWRGEGGDVGWIGKGGDREQWITFRDHYCYRGVVRRAPLYPLNSLMHHGIVHGRAFQGARVGKAGPDLKNEARSYFGAGPTLQELYLTPSMMTEDSWRHVAEAAKWAHANAEVLVDTHWIGGVPGKLEPYGYASWSPRRGTLTLRNPDDAPREIAVDVEEAFELPPDAPRRYRLESPYADQRVGALTCEAGVPHTFRLGAFEVLVFDAVPR